jgi:hypothetical protein
MYDNADVFSQYQYGLATVTIRFPSRFLRHRLSQCIPQAAESQSYGYCSLQLSFGIELSVIEMSVKYDVLK